jgi:hypothetical protein
LKFLNNSASYLIGDWSFYHQFYFIGEVHNFIGDIIFLLAKIKFYWRKNLFIGDFHIFIGELEINAYFFQ